MIRPLPEHLHRLRDREALTIDCLITPANICNVIFGLPAASQTDDIQTACEVVARQGMPWCQVCGRNETCSDHRAATDANVLVNAGVAADVDAVFEFDMPAERRALHHRAIVMNNRVVTDVTVGHEEVIVANCRWADICESAVNCRGFAECVAIADDGSKSIGLRIEPGMLRGKADACKGVDEIILADGQRPLQPDVADEPRARAEFDVTHERAIRPDDNIVSELYIAVKNGSVMNIRHGRV